MSVTAKRRNPNEAELPIARLRRIAAAHERGEAPRPDDAAWFASAVRRYEAEASAGLDLGRALSFVPLPGGDAWWTLEARQKRDAVLHAWRRGHFADLSIPKAARAIARAARRLQATAFGHGQQPRDPQKALLSEALQTGQPFPGARQIETILRN